MSSEPCPTPWKRRYTKAGLVRARARGVRHRNYRCVCGSRHFTSWAAGDYPKTQPTTDSTEETT